jgi:hypothetical protein
MFCRTDGLEVVVSDLAGGGGGHNTRRLAWGLDLSRPEVTSAEEIEEFRRNSAQTFGFQQDGLDYWLDEKPEVLKRYRAWADSLWVRDADEAANKRAPSVAIMYVYAMTGFQSGLEYGLNIESRGLTQEQLLAQMALAFRYVGPRGMATIAAAARNHVWVEPQQPFSWPAGWAPDPDAFKSGVDFSDPAASAEDVEKIVAWYERWLGEVPRHVGFLARYRPELLKASRSRFENTLRLLPKQTDPYSQIQIDILRGYRDGIREGVLLARGFGLSRSQVLEAIGWGTFYGGNQSLGLVDEVAGDILATWPNQAVVPELASVSRQTTT